MPIMWNTSADIRVIRHDGNLTEEKIRKREPEASVFCISQVSSLKRPKCFMMEYELTWLFVGLRASSQNKTRIFFSFSIFIRLSNKTGI